MDPLIQFISDYTHKTLSELSMPTLQSPVVYSKFSAQYMLSRVYLPRLSYVPQYMFANCRSLSEIYIPNAYQISASAFMQCALSYVDFPNVSSIGPYAFANCSYLSSIYLPNLENIEVGAFAFCSALEFAELPISIYQYSNNIGIFNACNNLWSLSFPNLIKVMNEGFAVRATGYLATSCPNLSYVYLPKCVSMYGGFNNCTNLDFSGIDAPNLLECSGLTLGGTNSMSDYSALTQISHSKLLTLRAAIFGKAPNLSRIYLPEVQTLSLYQSVNRVSPSSLAEIYLPKLQRLESSLFNTARVESLTIDWSSLTYINGCIGNPSSPYLSSITSISLPNCSFIYDGMIVGCEHKNSYLQSLYAAAYIVSGISNFTALEYVDLPNLQSVSTYTFFNCSSLTQVNCPAVTLISMYGFGFPLSGPSLPELHVSVPNCRIIASFAFASNRKLREIHLPVCSQISTYTFLSCNYLMSVYLYSSSVVNLDSAATYVFSSTPMVNSNYTGSFGSVFVPASLLNYYKASLYWASISERLAAIPE